MIAEGIICLAICQAPAIKPVSPDLEVAIFDVVQEHKTVIRLNAEIDRMKNIELQRDLVGRYFSSTVRCQLLKSHLTIETPDWLCRP